MLVGLTGVGGGSLMTPLLVLLFGFHPSTAVGTDLLFASATKTVGSGVHGWRGSVDWRIVRRLAMGSVPAALVTLIVMGRAGQPSPAFERGITLTLGLTLICTAIAMLLRKRIVAAAYRRFGPSGPQHRVLETVVLGALLGVLVSISSVGAGAIGVTALLVLYPRLPVSRIVGSDIAHAVPLTLVAGIGHWLIGTVDFGLLAALLIGSVPGIILGSLIGSRAPDGVLQPLLAAVLTLVGVKLLLS
ncbi:putative membrane transporter protein [Sphingomonas antarctica]